MLKRIVALLSLTILVVANDSQCDTGTIMCCDTKSTVDHQNIAQQVITDLHSVTVLRGGRIFRAGGDSKNECSGVSVVGTSQGCSANQEPLCCEKVDTNGLVNFSCSPINVNA
ncbi:uncharacterized protein BJ212DRAFT_1293626 [Suillus subaureus]|uniref:Hydrophobin n=1 Tax=Suillus subaureus TaxID=48587 RepID=A0A9P7DGG4_9AGAM|nr:uncharacterized protein BJ212DRAFT_1293626 [Suillus subaureus]KAG1791800.1 hypothetical protein BJ212DRAFT_1293626 [Suillus subaureus]